jgi:hypothetical protein
MPEPLLVEKYCTAYRQVAEMQSNVKRLQAIQLLIQLLPTEHARLLQQLFSLLQRVDAEPENRMTADNLAILFVPHIIVPRKTPTSELQQTYASFTGLVSFMISNADKLFSFPEPLVRDIHLYYHFGQQDATPRTLSDDEETSWTASCGSLHKQCGTVDSDDEIIITSIGFADRQASQLAAVQFDTAKAIADLYAHVSQMPDSAYKRRLLKQFNKSMNTGTPASLAATSSRRRNLATFTQSIKRILTKRHRSSATCDESIAACPALETTNIETSQMETPSKRLNVCNCETPAPVAETPVRNLFAHDSTPNHLDCNSRVMTTEPINCLSGETDDDRPPSIHGRPDDDMPQFVIRRAFRKTFTSIESVDCHSQQLRDSGVTDLDGDFDNENDDALWCADKENMPVSTFGCDSKSRIFPFHPTASVVAMERIFAKQRLPTYVRPKGYISPLQCPPYLMQSAKHSTAAAVMAVVPSSVITP